MVFSKIQIYFQLGGRLLGLALLNIVNIFQEEYGVAVFMDAGMVWDRVSSIRINDIQPSAGGGLRYISPIRPVRFDLVCRLKRRSNVSSREQMSRALLPFQKPIKSKDLCISTLTCGYDRCGDILASKLGNELIKITVERFASNTFPNLKVKTRNVGYGYSS